MSSYATNTTYDDAANLAQAARRVLLLTHGKPDGDALGSMLAVRRALARPGREVEMFLRGPLGWNLRPFVAAGERIHLLEEELPNGDADLIIITDTGARAQLDPIADWIRARRAKAIVIDHHVNGDVELANRRIVDAKAPSATFLVAGLIDAMKVPITGGPFSIAEALLLGLATDTGWFKFNNASPAAFRLAARLIEAGADKARVFAITEENDRPQRLALKARAIASIEYVAGGAAAVMTLLPKDFTETGADSEEMTGIVNEPLSIANVRVSALISSVEGKVTKISWRSKPAMTSPSLTEGGRQVGAFRTTNNVFDSEAQTPREPRTTNLPAIDVNQLARHFGGGGHVHAAGARVDRPLEEVRRDVIEGLEHSTGCPPARA
jgi:phosphoesterase RecJ-like protein